MGARDRVRCAADRCEVCMYRASSLIAMLAMGCGQEKPGSACVDTTLYLDEDGDGWGQVNRVEEACLHSSDDVPEGYALQSGDCDDADPSLSPGAEERCDGLDQDCDHVIDDDPVDGLTSYRDLDQDGYGDPDSAMRSCSQPTRWVTDGTDCDDNDPDRHPGVTDACDDFDSDCDGAVDEDGQTWYQDNDGDGFGAARGITGTCAPPPGYVDVWPDCDDWDDAVYPGAEEVCGDGVVNDCDGSLTDAEAACEAANQISLSDADATFLGDDSYEHAGTSVSAGGDVDGDGVIDLLIGAPDSDLGDTNAGVAYLTRADLPGESDLSASTARIFGEDDHGAVGTSVDIVGDVDRDGYDDLVIGAPGEGPDGDSPGLAYLVTGPVTGDLSLADATARLIGEAPLDGAGASVAGVGDLNGDGRDDFLVGAPSWSGVGEEAGAAWLVLGPVTGDLSLSTDAMIIPGWREGNLTGSSVAGVGDVDGDGLSDVLIGAPLMDHHDIPAGAAYLISGPLVGLSDLRDSAAFLEGEAGGALGGYAVAGGGDVNHDGYDDLVIGAPHECWLTRNGGAAYVVEGPISGYLHLSFATARILGENAQDNAGSAVAAGGDMDGDGFGDVIVGVEATDHGAAYVARGPLTGTIYASWTDLKLTGTRSGERAGYSVDFVSDVSADGRDDLLIGAPERRAHSSLESGATYLVFSPVQGI